MFTGLKNSMMGPPQIGGSVPQMAQGLGLPNGQAVFNLSGFKNTAPAPEVAIPSFAAPGSSFKLNITRTASSDPVQNIINDIVNPLGGSKIDMAPAPAPQQQPSLLSMDQANFDPYSHLASLAPPGQVAGAQWRPNLGWPGIGSANFPMMNTSGPWGRGTWMGGGGGGWF